MKTAVRAWISNPASLLIATSVMCLLCASNVSAAIITYTTPASQNHRPNGDPPASAGPWTIGHAFTVGGSSIAINALGVQDGSAAGPAADGIFAGFTDVGIWTIGGTLLGTARVVSNDPLSGTYRYAPLASTLTLTSGSSYVIGARVGAGIEWYEDSQFSTDFGAANDAFTGNGVTLTANRFAAAGATTLPFPGGNSGRVGRWGPANADLFSAAGPIFSSEGFESPVAATAGTTGAFSFVTPTGWILAGVGGVVTQDYTNNLGLIAEPAASDGNQLGFLNSLNSSLASFSKSAFFAGDLSLFDTVSMQADVGNTDFVNDGGDGTTTVTVGLWSPVTSSFVASDSFLLSTIGDGFSTTKFVTLDLSTLTAPQLAGALEVRLQSFNTSSTLAQTTFDGLLVSAQSENAGTPEPSTLILAVCGLLSLVATRARHRRT